MVENCPAEHIGKKDIEGYGRGAELAGEGEAESASGGDNALESLIAPEAEEDASIVRVVFNNKQHGIALDDIVAIVLDVLFPRGGQTVSECDRAFIADAARN